MRKKNNKKNIFLPTEEKNVVDESVKEEIGSDLSSEKEQWIVDAHGTTVTVLRKGNEKKIVTRLDKKVGEIVEL